MKFNPSCFSAVLAHIFHTTFVFVVVLRARGASVKTFLNGRLSPSPMIQTPALGPRLHSGNHTNEGTVLASRSTPSFLRLLIDRSSYETRPPSPDTFARGTISL